jgi:hypothetical protein
MRSTFFRWILLASIAVEVRIPTAWACSCYQLDTPTLFRETDAVYTAKVLSVGGFGRCNETDMRVTEAFKGVEVGETLTIKTFLGSSGGDCSLGKVPFHEGEEWLMYGGEDQQVALCSSDVLASDAQDDIEVLRGLAAE